MQNLVFAFQRLPFIRIHKGSYWIRRTKEGREKTIYHSFPSYKMGRPPCCDKIGIKKGPWTPEEDIILVSYIQEHGPGNWRLVPSNTGKQNSTYAFNIFFNNNSFAFFIFWQLGPFLFIKWNRWGYVHVYDAINFAFLSGLMRCSKSCRLRWTNYLRPGIKRGNFTDHEEKMIIHLQALLGNRYLSPCSNIFNLLF